mmetsp:Transcript_116750/g.310641  ORF Transcript_116750/g.310641 Transcript_116750/m.310641 type:complete len:667 (-) Transcript_116750:69-2069(-)
MPELADGVEAEPQWKKQAPVLKVRVPAPKKEGGGPSFTPRVVPSRESPFQRTPGADGVDQAVKVPAHVPARVPAHVPAPVQLQVDPEKVEALAKAAFDEHTAAEERVTEAMEVAKPLMAEAKEVTQEMAEEAAQAAEAAVNKAILAVQAAARIVSEKAKEMGRSEVALKIKSSSDFAGLLGKLRHHKKKLEEMRSAVQVAKKRTPNESTVKANRDVFDKFDEDKDGFLKHSELIAFAKGDCNFELGEEQADKVITSLSGEDAGVPFEKLQRLRAMVGIERVVFRAGERERKKAELQELAVEFNKELKEAEEIIAKTEVLVADLSSQTLLKLREAVDEVEASATAAKEQVDKAQGIVDSMGPGDGVEEDDLVKSCREELTSKFPAQKAAVLAVVEAAKAATEKSKKRFKHASLAEVEALRLQVAVAVRAAMQAKKKSAEQIFTQAAVKAEALAKEPFVKFVKSLADLCPSKALPEALRKDAIDTAKVEGLFSHVAGSAEDNLGKDKFLFLFTRLGYVVLKETALTAEKTDGETKRQLQVGEVAEALDFAESTAEGGAKCIRVRACKDGAEGWACIGEAGSEGGVRLELAGAIFTCVKETILTDALKISEGETVRRITRGELIEALDFEKKDDGCGIGRIQCKALRDGKSGWVSVAGNTGLAFLERLR